MRPFSSRFRLSLHAPWAPVAGLVVAMLLLAFSATSTSGDAGWHSRQSRTATTSSVTSYDADAQHLLATLAAASAPSARLRSGRVLAGFTGAQAVFVATKGAGSGAESAIAGRNLARQLAKRAAVGRGRHSLGRRRNRHEAPGSRPPGSGLRRRVCGLGEDGQFVLSRCGWLPVRNPLVRERPHGCPNRVQNQVPVAAVSDLREDVATMRALRYLDLVEPNAVVAWACRRATGGARPKGLVDLAELTDARGDDVDAQLGVLAEEVGLGPLTEQEAGVVAASQVARQLTRGTAAPIEAARRIWRIARLAPTAEPRLRVFIGLASEWEDDADNRASYEEEIRSEALNLAGWSE